VLERREALMRVILGAGAKRSFDEGNLRCWSEEKL
jgi:hypothetical protein